MLNSVGFGLMITIFMSIISGFIVNGIREAKVPIVPEYIGNESIKHITALPTEPQRFKGLLIDARPHRLFKECHFPSTVNFPPGNFDFFYGLVISERSKNRQLFILGRTYSHAYDEELAYQLFIKGHRNITIVALNHFCLK
jgi:hypothetical protein